MTAGVRVGLLLLSLDPRHHINMLLLLLLLLLLPLLR